MDWTSITEGFNWLLNPVGSVITDSSSAIAALKRQAQDWAQKVVNVYYTNPSDPKLIAQRRDLLNRAKYIKDKIESITGALDAFNPLNDIGLSALPILIPAAVIAAAAALITKWVIDHNDYMSGIDQYNKMVASGLDPSKATDLIAKLKASTKDKDTMDKLLAFAPFAIGGLVLYMFRDKLR